MTKRTFLFLIIVSAIGTRVLAYSGGSGTHEDPYQIASADDLLALRDSPADFGRHFILSADIDLSGLVFEYAVIAPQSTSRNRGPEESFSGTFIGDGHVVRNLHLDGEEYLGLFGRLDGGAVIRGVALEEVLIEGPAKYVGALAGYNSGVVEDCTASGRIAGAVRYAGGLIGVNSYVANVSNCRSSVAISGDGFRMGGLVGDNDGVVSGCHAIGEIVGGGNFVGGLVGENGGCVLCCLAEGAVAGASSAGGLVGGNRRGTILGSSSSGPVTGDRSVGGLVGDNGDGSTLNCHSSSVVAGGSSVGGLVGDNSDGSVANCYCIGEISGSFRIGGLIGYGQAGGVTGGFWDVETSGVVTSAGGIGLTTNEMHQIATYLEAGWDFVDEHGNGTAETWQMPAVGDYPRLSMLEDHHPVMPAGEGTMEEPFVLTSVEQLGTVAYRPCAVYRLENDIDLSDMTWAVSPIPWFGGTFDGSGHVIRNLEIRGAGSLGLFGTLGYGATVSGLGLDDCDVQAAAGYVGGLAGANRGADVSICYAVGTVAGDQDVGGLIGLNYSGSVVNCLSAGHVIGSDSVGGLSGSCEYGTVSGSYSTASVTGENKVGGLIGSILWGEVWRCYSCGPVSGQDHIGGLVGFGSSYGVVRHSFWDVDSSGRVASFGGAGLMTAEMMDPWWIGLQGWASDPDWVVNPHQDYPRLAWEGIEGQVVPEPIVESILGQGTGDEPYRINDASQLRLISKAGLLWDRCFVLTGDIDLGDVQWPQAVIPDFTGSFDGRGYTIENLTISGFGDVGLFGRLAEGGTVMNLHLLNVDVMATGDDAGALVGHNLKGQISNCHSAGRIEGRDAVGGLVGNNGDGQVSSSCTSGSIRGDNDVGGLVGRNYEGTLRDCYSSAGVIGLQWSTGGLTGNNSGQVLRCYSSGPVEGTGWLVGGLFGENRGLVEGCFWDVETSGQDESQGGEGLTTAEMMKIETYLQAGWDFVDEAENGTHDIWWIEDGADYPRFSWEVESKG